MRTICLALRVAYDSASTAGVVRSVDRAREHFRERGVDVQFFYGLDAPNLKIITTAVSPYGGRIEPPHGGRIDQRRVGNALSQRALWAACLLLPDDRFFLLEDDALFPEDWRAKLGEAFDHTPTDFDVLYVGSCCTKGRPTRHVSGPIYEVRWPLCTHGYIVNGHRVLERLIDTQDQIPCYLHMDVSLYYHSLPSLRVYTVLPRILGQFDTPHLPE